MTVVAAMRDASWRRYPGRARRYHAIKNSRALCGMRALFVMEAAIPLKDVPQALRCRRPGCRKAFEEAQVQRRTFSVEDRFNTYSFPAKGFTPTAYVYFQKIEKEK